MSSHAVPSPDAMITSFPNPTLPRVGEEASYEELVELRDAIKENYASLSTPRGGGEYGYLGGIVSDTIYNTICPEHPFEAPANPGPAPIIEQATTAVQSGNMIREWTEKTREWREWQSLERAAKKQLIEAIPSGMLQGIRCHHRGYNNVTAREMLTHVFNQYGNIDQQDILNNRARLTQEWDPNQPFSDLIQRVQAVQEYAADGYRPISERDVVDAIYTVIFNTGLYYDDCEKWNDKTRVEQTWANFKTYFTEAQRKVKRRQKATAKVGGFHGANSIINDQLGQANDALVNMATAASADREMMQLQAKTIAEQMTQIKDLHARLKEKDDEIKRIKSQGWGVRIGKLKGK